MRTTIGIIRRIDDLGRIVIPKEVRERIYGKRDVTGEPMEFYLQSDNTIVLKPYKATNIWEPVVNANGELTEFICSCGCSSQSASNYCPDCGTKMDNSNIESEIRIRKAMARGSK